MVVSKINSLFTVYCLLFTEMTLFHHVSIRTANIFRSLAFYELLGFQVQERFSSNYTLACWLEGLGSRIELMQIPEPAPAIDAFNDEHYVGYYHFAMDITEQSIDLSQWLSALETSIEKHNSITDENQNHLSFNVLLSPQQQMIGDKVYEVAFISDPDNLPIEIIRFLSSINIS